MHIKFREMLKVRRLELGLTLAEAGERVGVKRHTWARYEAGTRTPGKLAYPMFAKFLGVTVEELLDEDGSEPPRRI